MHLCNIEGGVVAPRQLKEALVEATLEHLVCQVVHELRWCGLWEGARREKAFNAPCMVAATGLKARSWTLTPTNLVTSTCL